MTTEQVHRSTDHINRLVSVLLDDAGGSPHVSKQSFAMRELVDEVLGSLSEAIREKGIEVQIHDLPSVTANRTMLQQVVQNLIVNSVRFCRHHPKIDISADRRGDEWVFRFKDNGIGIEHEDLHKVFLPPKAKNPDDRAGGCTGLTLSKKIIERHHGHISVHSCPGKGTTFYFTLPA